jgi:hypothetical protein
VARELVEVAIKSCYVDETSLHVARNYLHLIAQPRHMPNLDSHRIHVEIYHFTPTGGAPTMINPLFSALRFRNDAEMPLQFA